MAAAAIAAGLAGLLTAPALAAPEKVAPAGKSKTGRTQMVTIASGERITVTTDAAGRVTAAVPEGGGGSYVVQQRGADHFVLPRDAFAQFRRGLDPGLFDVSALMRDGVKDRIPVRVSFSSTGPRVAPAGVTLTGSAKSSTQDGYLTPAGGRTFGQALRASRPGAQASAAKSPLGTATAIRYAGSHATVATRGLPAEPSATVNVTVNAKNGQPLGDCLLGVVNVDDSGKYKDFTPVTEGKAQLTVPAGNYGMITSCTRFDGSRKVVGESAVFDNFTTAGAGTAVTVDMARATNELLIEPPEPATQQARSLVWYRGSSDDGSGFTYTIVNNDSVPFTLSEGPLNHGVQHLYGQLRLQPSDKAKIYDVVSPATTGPIGAGLKYRIDKSGLAAIDSHYYNEIPGRRASTSFFSEHSWETFMVRRSTAIAAPARRTEYIVGDPSIRYESMADYGDGDGKMTMTSGDHSYRAGQQAVVEWFRSPLAAGLPADTGVGTYYGPAYRTDDLLAFSISTGIDSTPGHTLLSPQETSGRIQLFQGAKSLADRPNSSNAEVVVPAARGTYRLVYDQTQRRSHTEWTFVSEHSGASTVPDHWYCAPDNCSALSLVTVGHTFDQGLDNRIKVGANNLTVHIGHNSGGSNAAITKAVVLLSYDGGKTWSAVPVSAAGNGDYKGKMTVPASAAGHAVSIKTEAADNAGAAVSQVLYDAVPVS